jgi:hypothetical protein
MLSIVAMAKALAFLLAPASMLFVASMAVLVTAMQQ